MGIVLWTCSSPDPLTQGLAAAGYRVWEALALSEVTYLCDTENIGAVVIRNGVNDQRAAVLRRHYITIKLEQNTETREIIEALWNLFPGRTQTVQ